MDFDNDGILDLFFTNGAGIPSLEKDDATFYNRLYRNNRDGTTRLMSWSRIRKLIHRWRIQLKSGVVPWPSLRERRQKRLSTGWNYMTANTCGSLLAPTTAFTVR